MGNDVIMSALGMGQAKRILPKWLKKPGDPVKKGEPLMEVETDKATVEVEAPASGVLQNVTAKEGDEIPVGRTIAVIAAAVETVKDTAQSAKAPHPSPLPKGEGIKKEKMLSKEERTIAATEASGVPHHLDRKSTRL